MTSTNSNAYFREEPTNYNAHNKQRPMPDEDEDQDQTSVPDLLDESLMELDTKSELRKISYHQAEVIEAHEQDQDRVSSKHERQSHSRRRRKTIKVDYRLKSEHWPGLL